jgi:hypothetical protein
MPLNSNACPKSRRERKGIYHTSPLHPEQDRTAEAPWPPVPRRPVKPDNLAGRWQKNDTPRNGTSKTMYQQKAKSMAKA